MTADPTKPTPPEVYEAVLVPAVLVPLTRFVVDLAAPREGERVLDLACGTGIAARTVAPIVGSSGTVVGVDVAPPMLEVARSLPPPEGATIEWREGDASALVLPDASFDVVVCQQGLQFFPDRAATAAEVLRVLAPGGRFVAAVWQGIDRQPFWKGFSEVEARNLAPLGLTIEDARLPFSWGDAEPLRSLLEEAGFSSIELSTAMVMANFAAEGFVENLEYPYGALVHGFLEDPDAFAAFVDAVKEQSRDVLESYRREDRIIFETPANLVIAHRPA
ncbi:MAG TPA: methyltransferase domain-containing protein [Actinomycetota bacterium]|nr:methyltransferase domain-containing protein [Actinomycetota bacterium]